MILSLEIVLILHPQQCFLQGEVWTITRDILSSVSHPRAAEYLTLFVPLEICVKNKVFSPLHTFTSIFRHLTSYSTFQLLKGPWLRPNPLLALPLCEDVEKEGNT